MHSAKGYRMDEQQLMRVLLQDRLRVIGYTMTMVRRLELAEDIFQEVCMLALERRESITDESHLHRWLRATARNLAYNLMRKRQERQLTLDDGILDSLESLWIKQDDHQATDIVEALRHCMDRLPPASASLVRKRYVQGISYTELADILHRPVASLYVTFSRIHAALADCIYQRLATGRGGHD